MLEVREAAALALAALREAGADKAAVSAEFDETWELNLEGGEFTLYRSLHAGSLELTALTGGKKGNLRIESLEAADIRAAAGDCLAVARAGAADPAWDLAPTAETGVFESGPAEPDMDRFFFRLRELTADIGAKYPTILLEALTAAYSRSREVYLNSNGADFETAEGGYDVGLTFSAHQGEDDSSFWDYDFATAALDAPFLSQGTLADDLSGAARSLRPEPISGKFTGTVLLHPRCLAELLDLALDLFASDLSLIDGTSPWRDKLGQPVADPRLTLRVAPLDERILGGERHTAEGFRSRDYDLIDRGVLRSFLLSLYGANKTGLPRALNGDDCLVMAPGDRPLRELIAGIRDGLYVGRFSGGSPGPGGDFSGVAKNSFRIRNGALAEAVGETMIAGNLRDMLFRLEAVSAEQVCDGRCVLPWAAFGGVVISGGEETDGEDEGECRMAFHSEGD